MVLFTEVKTCGELRGKGWERGPNHFARNYRLFGNDQAMYITSSFSGSLTFYGSWIFRGSPVATKSIPCF